MTTNNKSVTEASPTAVAEVPVETARPVYEPAPDVIEKQDGVHVLLDMPGVDQKGLEVTIEEHTLMVRGKSAVTETNPGAALHREFEPAEYERSFRLTADIDESRITANLKHGVLRLVLPKSEAARPRQITIKHE